MRIAHVSDWFLPHLGGIELHVADLASRQRERGDEVCVLTTTPADSDGDTSSTEAGDVPVRRVRALAQVHGSDLSDFDVVHAHVSAVSPLASTVAASASRAGIPSIVTVHSMWTGLGPLPRAATTVFGLRSSEVVWTAVSEVAAELVRRSLPRHTAVRVLPNAVDVGPRSGPPAPAPDGAVTLVSTMRLARRKRPLPLVRMLDGLRRAAATPVRLVLVGDGPQRGLIEDHVRRHRLDDQVEVTGRLDRDDVLTTLAAADVYVAPTPRESFGLAALEARCVGLPVVARAGSGVVQFVSHGVNGLLARTDAEMVNDLAQLVDDLDLRGRMAEHNRTTPPGMTWAESLSRHDDVYAFAASAARRRRLLMRRRPVEGSAHR